MFVDGQIPCHPGENIGTVPTNATTPETHLSRKLPQQRQCSKSPAIPPGQASDVVGSEELLPVQKLFIHPYGNANWPCSGGRWGGPGAGCVDIHDRCYSQCVVPVV
jgi:hypothetical protein